MSPARRRWWIAEQAPAVPDVVSTEEPATLPVEPPGTNAAPTRAPAPAWRPPFALHVETVDEVIGADAGPATFLGLAHEVAAEVAALRFEMLVGRVAPMRRMVRGRPLCDFLPPDVVGALLVAGARNVESAR